MKVYELKALLNEYPDDMDVIVDLFSDYAPLESTKQIDVVENSTWFMRVHPTMSDENKSRVKTCLCLGP